MRKTKIVDEPADGAVPEGGQAEGTQSLDHGHGAVGSEDYGPFILSYGTGNPRYVCF